MYIIFIFFAAGIGAPLLFGVSTYLVGALSTQFSTFQTGQVAGLSAFGGGGVGGPINISPSFLTLFALASLTMTSFFGGLMMGVVKGGSEKEGLKMIPVLLVVSLSVFFIVRTIVAGILVI
jgi:archaellum biogenesis protein FlaJ (TadC family)